MEERCEFFFDKNSRSSAFALKKENRVQILQQNCTTSGSNTSGKKEKEEKTKLKGQ
jgi:hypothetical protein